ncbi:MAG: DUF3551 domain-containing protein [Bradyrhizobium sp.]
MRKAFVALAAAYAVLVAVPAMAGGLPSGVGAYCIKGCDYGGGIGDCSFASLAQCQATASGRVATCSTNPYFSARAEMPADQGRMSRRRF